MYTAFTFKNFRGFRDFHLPGLARVNLITGKNGVGKTSVLEGMFLHAGRSNAGLPGMLETFRGRNRFALTSEVVWGWLFNDKRMDEDIHLIGTDENNQNLPVFIRLEGAAPEREPTLLQGNGVPPEVSEVGIAYPDLVIEYEGADGKAKKARAQFDLSTKTVKTTQEKPVSKLVSAFVTTRAGLGDQEIGWFSDLDSKGETEGVLDVLRYLDGRVARLSIAVEGNVPLLKVRIDGVAEAMPIHDLGQGACRVLQIVLALRAAENSIVFVDEIENGIHHSAMHGIWRAIAYLAGSKKHSVQVVATTHSMECVKAAYEAFSGKGDGTNGFAAFRLDRVGEEVKAARFDMQDVQTAVENDVDVRGF